MSVSAFNPGLLRNAALDAIKKLNPRFIWRNPVLFVLEMVTLCATLSTVLNFTTVNAQIVMWLWFTLLFANFSESLAEGRGKAQALSLRKTKAEAMANKLRDANNHDVFDTIPATQLRRGDLVIVRAGDLIPSDGEVVHGIATVDESAITGESAPVIRESGGDRSAVTGGTRVVSDVIIVSISSNPGESFIDRMINLVEGAARQKTPNEIALSILLTGISLIFLLVVVALYFTSHYFSISIPLVYLIALFVALIPTTIGGLLSAIGIAGMDRLVKFNVIAKSGRAVESAGDIDVLLLDKTGTITLGSRMAAEFIAMPGISDSELAHTAALSSLDDDTNEGKSIVSLARDKYHFTQQKNELQGAVFIPFTAQTRMSGVDYNTKIIRKGASDTIAKYLQAHFAQTAIIPKQLNEAIERVARAGGTPLVVVQNHVVLGVIYLKDIIKPNIRVRFDQLRQMGIRTVMITGDNPLTAAAIAAEAGVDDFLAEATPEMKLDYIRTEQAKGRMVAMCGDGSNDAPALAQSDVGVAMNTGTQAAREAGNMVDLDSDPTKLIEIVMIGKQLLMTRGALTTFSVANDIAKYFAIVPALLMAAFPAMGVLNIMQLQSPASAILSAIIFNALIIVALVPLALRGVAYRPSTAIQLLRRNVLLYGVGGLLTPFIGIKLLDILITTLGWV